MFAGQPPPLPPAPTPCMGRWAFLPAGILRRCFPARGQSPKALGGHSRCCDTSCPARSQGRGGADPPADEALQAASATQAAGPPGGCSLPPRMHACRSHEEPHRHPQRTCGPRQSLFATRKRRAGNGPDLCTVCRKQHGISGVVGCALKSEGFLPDVPREKLFCPLLRLLGAAGHPRHPLACGRVASVSAHLPSVSHRHPRGEPACTFPCFVGSPGPTAWGFPLGTSF